MSASSSFARALSPGAARSAHLLEAATTLSEARDARHMAILSCRSVEEIVELIPSDYREKCADLLKSAVVHVERLYKARSTLAKWKHHLSVGTFPPHLRTSASQVQFTAGYGDTEAAKAAQRSINDKHHAYQVEQLTLAIKAREAEVVYLEAAIEAGKVRDDLLDHLVPMSTTIVGRYKVPEEYTPAGATESSVRLVQSPAAEAIRDQVLIDCGIYASAAVSITLNRMSVMDAKIEKKRAISAAATVAAGDGADAVMGDATLTSAIKQEIKRTVMGLMPRENRAPKGNATVKAARKAAAAVSAKTTPRQSGSKYVSILPGHIPIARARRLQSMFGRPKKSRKGKGKKQPVQVVVAKDERGPSGQQKSKKKKSKGKKKAQ
ncbi:hypothetical protein BJY52DRAFT_1195510 [Lactarius psammicola]|nr:hypothetical protein BJY52DRAFT_1195510 [Lactarius psammicola]